jgi:hypothetical protein
MELPACLCASSGLAAATPRIPVAAATPAAAIVDSFRNALLFIVGCCPSTFLMIRHQSRSKTCIDAVGMLCAWRAQA